MNSIQRAAVGAIRASSSTANNSAAPRRLSSTELKVLALELAAAMPPAHAETIEVVLATGEAFSSQALRMARLYQQADHKAQAALDAVAAAFSSQVVA